MRSLLPDIFRARIPHVVWDAAAGEAYLLAENSTVPIELEDSCSGGLRASVRLRRDIVSEEALAYAVLAVQGSGGLLETRRDGVWMSADLTADAILDDLTSFCRLARQTINALWWLEGDDEARACWAMQAGLNTRKGDGSDEQRPES